MSKILLIANSTKSREYLQTRLTEQDIQVDILEDITDLIQNLHEENYDWILIFDKISGISPTTIMYYIHSIFTVLPVVFVYKKYRPILIHTLYKYGVFDCRSEQGFRDALPELNKKITEYYHTLTMLPQMYKHFLHTQGFWKMTGNSRAMQKIYQMIAKVLQQDLTVSIFGESGTGKEIIAQLLHRFSNRSEEKFITINCAAVPENLLESELFGHIKGSFTGAVNDRVGKFEYADKGCIFLDEIGEMTLPLQAKLLRIIEQGTFERVGSNTVKYTDVRLITATNRNLEEMVKEGTFREDLLHRIMVFPINLPKLNHRDMDVLLITHKFINSFSNSNLKGVSEAVRHFLLRNTWDGNVRQLQNSLVRYSVLNSGEILDINEEGISDIPNKMIPDGTENSHNGNEGITVFELEKISDMEKWLIDRMLKKSKGNMSEAARKLGISRMALYRKLDSGMDENEHKAKTREE